VRPVNLIPAEDRPGGQRPLRTGPLAYMIVGALAALLIGVTALVVTNSQISERQSKVTTLEAEKTAAEAQAHSLASYAQFHSVREQRVATVTGLADSRFDWARVMHELSLVLPGDVWLTSLTGSASSGSGSTGGGSGVAMRSSIAGPALELVGCASSQTAVAGFVQALKDIDGVTRVGMQSSSLGGAGKSSGSAAASTCQTSESIAQFQMVVAFDAAPAPPKSEPESAAAAPESTPATSSGESTSSTTSTTPSSSESSGTEGGG
jgi:Tfp pilus assembly protein PilN